MNQIENLLPQSILYPLIYTPENGLQKTFILNYFFETLKGYLGYSSAADQKMIRHHSLRLLEDVQGILTKENAAKISEFALSAGLISSQKTMLTQDEIVKEIASHLNLDPSLNTFEKISKCYQRALPHLTFSEEKKTLEETPIVDLKKEEIGMQKSSWNWKLIGSIALIAAGAFLWVKYSQAEPSIEMNPYSGEPVNFSKVLSPICRESVLKYCTQDGSKCLKDYLDPKWIPNVFRSPNDIYPICNVDLIAENCGSLVNQESGSLSHAFLPNFERVPAILTPDQKNNPIVKWAITELPALRGATVVRLLV